MTQETRCPACGAPLVVTGARETVECSFCGAALRIDDESGQAAFRVVGQPEPQKETLSKPVEGHGAPTGAAQVYTESMVGEEAVRSSPPSFEPELVSTGASVYPANTQRKGLSGTNRWVLIGGVVILGLLLLCACGAIAVAAAMRANF